MVGNRVYVAFIITLLIFTLFTLNNSSSIVDNSYEQSIIQETKYFPAKIESSRITKLPRMYYSITFHEVAFTGSYYIGVEEQIGLWYVYYNFVVININGTVFENITLDRVSRENWIKPKYNLIAYRDMAVLICGNYFYYVYGLNTTKPVAKIIGLSGESIVQYLCIDDFIILFTAGRIYCLRSAKIALGERLSPLSIVNGYLFDNTLYLITYGREAVLVGDKTIEAYKVFVEKYILDLDSSRIVSGAHVYLGHTSVLNKYVAGLSPSGLIFINNIAKSIVKHDLGNLNKIVNQTIIQSPRVYSGFVIDKYIAVIHGDDNIKYIDVYEESFSLIYRTLLPYVSGFEKYIVNIEVFNGLDNKYVVVLVNILNEQYVFITFDLKYGLSNTFQYSVRETNETIIDFKLINKGSLTLIQTVNVYNRSISNLYITSIDFKYIRKISSINKLYCVYESPFETIVAYNKFDSLILTRITGTAVVIVIGIPSIITYTNYRDVTNTIYAINTPSIFNIEATRMGIKCVPLRGYSGPSELYRYIDIVFENNRVHYLNTTEFSAILVLTGKPALLLFKDQFSGLSFSIEYTGNTTVYYIPPSNYIIEVIEGTYSVVKTTMFLERNRVSVLNIDEITQNYQSGESSVFKFIVDNMVYVLIGLTILLLLLLVAGIISVKRG